MDELLAGGVANAGAVRRRGDVVVRPTNAHSPTIHAFLRALRAAGFDGAPEPMSLGEHDETLRFIEGDVAIPPYPAWAQADAALASVARLLRRFHDASLAVSGPLLDQTWSDAFGDQREGATAICHFDVCLENVVFRDGMAVALLDFDFAAPGDPLDDLASFVRMCVPVDDGARRDQLAWKSVDVAKRIRVALDAYGVEPADRRTFLGRLDDSITRAEHFVRTRVERGEPNFVAMWESFGGEQRFVRRRTWFDTNRAAFQAVLEAPGLEASKVERDLEDYYDQDAALRDSRPIDPERLARRDEFIGLLQAEGRRRVCEIGTGPGRDARVFIETGVDVAGVDLSAEHVRFAREAGVDAYRASVYELPFPDDSFDCAWTMSTLIHVPNQRWSEAVGEVCRVLSDGSPLAIGLWGTGTDEDIEEVLDADTIIPKRFFSRRSDATLRSILAPFGTIESFTAWPSIYSKWTYQYVVLRIRK